MTYTDKILPLVICFTISFLGCKTKDKDSEYSAFEEQVTKGYGNLDKNRCKQLQDFVEKTKNSKTLDSLKGNFDKFNDFLKEKFGLACDDSSLTAKYGPWNVNVYLENSYSMDAYVGTKKEATTAFRRDVANLLNTLDFGGVNSLFYITDSEAVLERSNNKIGDIFERLNLESLDEKSSRFKRQNTMFLNIFDAPLERVNSTNMSLIISDFIVSIPKDSRNNNADVDKYIEQVSNKIYHKLTEKKKSVKDLSLLVLRMESDIHDCYYDINDNCKIDENSLSKLSNKRGKADKEFTQLQKDGKLNRPYFIWIIGTVPQIEHLTNSQFFRNIPSENFKAFFTYNKLEYKPINISKEPKKIGYDSISPPTYGFFPKNDSIALRKTKKTVIIPIKLKIGDVPDGVSNLDSVSNYDAKSPFFQVKKILKNKDGKYTHRLILEAKQPISKDDNIESFDILVKNDGYTDSWKKYSYKNGDEGNEWDEGKTIGLETLMKGVHNAFYGKPIDTLKIKIGVK
ncbi:MAG: hypothetical protein LBC64_03230 [Fibromonadaceae bacterium]|jgi:hypothetical protein|nr:hypothetical protein [Fibromonadaceae bacterium]